MNNEKILQKEVDALATLVEEGARANIKNTQRFIEPAQGTLRRAQSKRHHMIFGRRGSGKSSLLYKTAEKLASEGHPIAFVDLEPFKGHQYPDIILSVLIATLSKYKIWLINNYKTETGKRLWYTLWVIKKKINENKRKELINRIDGSLNKLIEQLHLSDKAKLIQRFSDLTREEKKAYLKGSVKSKIPLQTSGSIEADIAKSVESTKGKETQEEFKRSKKDFLLREILIFQQIFSDFSTLTSKDCYLFLDDLYHIIRNDQAQLLDYFHRITKGNHVWLKIGTLKNRTTWYLHTPQPIGLKIADDADEINLDLTLEKFALSKDFLKSVLSLYIKEVKSPTINELIADGGVDRLVISSGGVARDFLGLFRRSIDEARERIKGSGIHPRGPKIGAEDVNKASGTYGDLKKDEFHKDTMGDQNDLENAFEKIKIFCLEKTKKNIFLVDQDLSGKNHEYLLELIDLRLIHQVKSRITVSAKPGKVFRAHLLDVSQYTGERARRDVEMIDFWKDSNKEVLRRASLIYNPDIDIESMKREIERQKRPIQENTKKLNSNHKEETIELEFD